uniref:NADH-ubiquinone oxidoreductase chain 5 n=1 Tax=Capitonius sp. QL-2013 TaxID=1421593 RepID=A0A0A6ZLQ2_9HYME|nr:NADH dehydrogenase subunit 5 [Capitonius sp. QL-2013]
MYLLISMYLMILSIMFFYISMIYMLNKYIFLINWMILSTISMKIEYIMYFDWMTMIFFSTILLISSMVLIYSLNYMEMEIFINRFMMMILIFIISMLFMIMSPNMISILLGWDGLGLSSYCLIIYYQNKKSFNSGMITILMNRIGDINIIIMISLLISKNSWNFMFLNNFNTILMFFIFMASITKSAQMPFSIWLPLAMAAPTPVSSLVHSSTLVTAGIYLLIRFHYLMNNLFLNMLMILSCMTMFMASSSANFEFDLKKIIALSTLSQLGLMFLTISLNLPMLAFFHLITHAMFKSLLFLCSGIMIHNYFNNQDIRYISMLNLNMPLTMMIFNIASLSLSGMPFLTGFYSKDLIIEMFNMNNFNPLLYNIMYLSMSLTLSYSLRLIFFISLKQKKNYNFMIFKFNNFMNNSIYILMLLSITYGSTLNWLMFNELNLIILSNYSKMLIYKYLILSIFLSMMFSKMNFNFKFIMLINKFYIFFNYMWLLQMILKKNKFNMFKLNNNLIFLKDSNWMEMISSKQIIKFLIKMNSFKMINKLNFSLMFTLMTYLLIFMMLMY